MTFPILDPAKQHTVDVRTNLGRFAFRLNVEDSPCMTSSFASLVRKRFFDGTTFHRIVRGFVIQGGDPTGTGSGGPGYTVVDVPPDDAAYTRGVVAMAKTGAEPAGTAGSQFFVVTGKDALLPARVRAARRRQQRPGRRHAHRDARRCVGTAHAQGRRPADDGHAVA